MTIEEKIIAIEEEIRNTQYNKATQHHIGKLRAKIAKLKEEALKKGGGGKGEGFSVRKSGDATVVLAGFPSVGKSTLINKITDAQSEVGAYDFTTLKVVPGLMEYKGARIQILDLPGIISGASSGKGRGREIITMVRSADLIIMIIDVFNPFQYQVLLKELYEAGIRLDQKPPQVKINRTERGGVSVSSTVKLTKINQTEIKGALAEFRIYSADVVIREDLGLERFIDSLAGNRAYIPSIVVLNKVDLVKEGYLKEVEKELKRDYIPISAKDEVNLEKLRAEIYKRLDFIRVFMKPKGGKADMEAPMIVMRGSTVGDICNRIHKELAKDFRYAKIWGKSVKFSAQRAGLEHVLQDGDVITIVAQS